MAWLEHEKTVASSFVCTNDDEDLARYLLEAGRAVVFAKRAASLAAGYLLIQTASSRGIRDLRVADLLPSAKAYLAEASKIARSASVPSLAHHRQSHLRLALTLIEQGIAMASAPRSGGTDLRSAAPLKQALGELQLTAIGLGSDEVAAQSCCCEFFRTVLRSSEGKGNPNEQLLDLGS